MEKAENQGVLYTVTVSATQRKVSFCSPYGKEPPSKVRLHNGTTLITVFTFVKESNSYEELSKSDLERFDRGYKTGRCLHFESGTRETGDERFDKRLAKLQKKLKEKKTNADQCSYCDEYGVLNIEIPLSDQTIVDSEVQFKAEDLKVSQPEAMVLGPFSVQISWKESVANNEHLARFMFELQMSKSKNSSFQTIYSGPEQSFTQNDLLPGTKYYFRLRAVRDSVVGQFSSEICVLTEATVPSTPVAPHISSKTRTSLLLKWTNISDNGSPITSYILQYKDGDGDGIFRTIYEGPQKQYKFNHKLAPMATCRFRVKAVNKIGESDFSPELHYTASAGVPSTPEPPELVKSTANTLQLSWKRPNANGADVMEYILQMDDVNKGYGFLPVYRGSDMTCTVDDNLKRNTSYRFRLCAINAQGESKWSDIISYSTTSEPPGRMLPPLLEGKVHTKSFSVTWVQPSNDGGSKILRYSLEIDDGKGGPFHEAYSGQDLNFKFQDLLPGQKYKIRVSCASEHFQSPWSEVSYIKTLPVVPDPPFAPRISRNHKPQPDTIELVWEHPGYDGGASISNFNVQVKKANEEDFMHVYLGPKNSCSVTGLSPNCEYSFRVRAQNSAGDSKFSKTSSICTAPGAPDPVQELDVSCRSSNALRISWKVPTHNGTPVTGYLLEWARSSSGPFEKLYHGVDNKYDLKGSILPFTVYYFRVQATSAAGYGGWSDIATCKTPAAPPAQVTHVKMVGQTSTSIKLQWRAPSHNGAPITSYNIDVIGYGMKSYKVEEVENSASAQDDSNEFATTVEQTIFDLQPHKQYRFRVQGVNKSGCGAFSLPIAATTGSIPPAALVLEVTNSSYQSIKLHWIFSNAQNDSNEINFDLQMRCGDTGSFETVFKGSGTSYKVGKLREQTSYYFRIRAANEAGYGPFSDILVCQTDVQPPAAVKGLNFYNVSGDKATIFWKNVSQVERSDRISYLLQLQRKGVAKPEQLYEGDKTMFTCNNLSPGKSYNFRVCAVRTLVDTTRVQGAFTGLMSVTMPCEVKEDVLKQALNEDLHDDKPAVNQLSERQLALIFFFGFAIIVVVMALLISIFIS